MHVHPPFPGRVEDRRLVTGGGRYTSDLPHEHLAHAAFLRAPLAHADIVSIDVSAALAMPGVLCVLTSEDMAGRGYGRAPHAPGQRNRDGTPMVVPDWPPLAAGRIRFAGEPVAVVVADSAAQAVDALDAIAVEYDALPVVTSSVYVAAPPVAVWPHAPENIALDYHAGDAETCAAAFARAAHHVRVAINNQRVIVNPMEPRAAVGEFDAKSGTYLLHAGSQGAAQLRDQIAVMMNLPGERVRVVSHDVGGGFGAKLHVYPEYVGVLVAAERLGRPVRWVSTRSEGFLSDTQGRDTVIHGELALDAEGRFLAVRLRCDANIGAYHSSHATLIATANVWRCIAGMYRTPVFDVRIRCLYSNTVPVAPYRGAGRPEAALVMERLVEAAAVQTGIDKVTLRRRNLVTADAFPYAAPNGMVYDGGDFTTVFDRALALADHNGFAARREAARKAGRLRGLGIGCYVEIAGGTPFEDARLDLEPDGTISVRGGFHSNGQGHATVFPAIVASRLGIPAAQVRLAESDSALVSSGVGSFASRSMTVGGIACVNAAQALTDRLREVAAPALDVPPEATSYREGRVIADGTNRSLGLAEIAALAGPVAVTARGEAPATFPNGCHVAEVEIDPRTGVTRFVSYVAVDDVGNVMNETLVHGQVQGGIAQGLGQVLVENAVYDETGQLATGSFMDYAMPRADDLPALMTSNVEIPAVTNPLGTKGAGEGGATGALAAGYNAVIDALSQAGVTSFDMPATPPRVWAALHDATPEGAAA